MQGKSRRILSIICTIALVSSMLGIEGKNVSADADSDATVALTPWSFFQLGDASSSWGDEDIIRYNSVTLSDGTVINEFNDAVAVKDDDDNIDVQGGVTKTNTSSDSIILNIASNGYQSDYRNQLNNPWAMSAYMDGIKLSEGHDYKISFHAKATSDKYASFSIKNAYSESGISEIIKITTDEQDFSYDYGCYYANTNTTFEFLLGAFPYVYGNVDSEESEWSGTIEITDVKFTDLGLNPNYDFEPQTGGGETPTNNRITSNWENTANPYEENDKVLGDTTFESDAENIAAQISITGWQAHWCTEEEAPDDAIILGVSDSSEGYWGDKPYQIMSENTAKVDAGETYILKFTVHNEMMVKGSQEQTEKNITVNVKSGEEDDADSIMSETIKVPAGTTETYSFSVPISNSYKKDTVRIQIAYGSYFYSYTLTEAVNNGEVSEEDALNCSYAFAYPTTEGTNAHGKLTFNNIAFYNPDEKIKNESDVEVLSKLIDELRNKGMTKIRSNLNSNQYVWSNDYDSRLIGIKWGGLNLEGEIDFSGLDELEQLIVRNNNLTGINISNNKKLKYLDCSGNLIENLDVNENSELEILRCSDNSVSEIDLTNNEKLQTVDCDDDIIIKKNYTKDANEVAALQNIIAELIANGIAVDEDIYSEKYIWSYEENAKLTGIDWSDCGFKGAVDLSVLAQFDSLKSLDVSDNEITSLNVDQLTNLTNLDCSNNKLSNLDVSKNKELKVLDCSGNQLKTLDVSKNTKLEELLCAHNQLTSLNLSNNSELKKIDCSGNELKALNVSNNLKLEELSCADNQITSLNVSNNTDLQTLNCGGNELSSLDLSKNTKLIDLDCKNNNITELDVSNNPEVKTLDCGGNQLTELDVSNNSNLEKLACEDNQISDLDLSRNPNLIDANYDDSVYVVTYKEKDTSDVEKINSLIKELIVKGANVSENLDSEQYIWSNNEPSRLVGINWNSCGLTGAIDFSEFECLESIDVANNNLIRINLNGNNTLISLDCSGNPLGTINVSNNPKLEELYCNNAFLSSLDVTNNPELIILDCGNNDISDIDVSQNTMLEELYCKDNELKKLDLKNNTELIILDCSNNQIRSLDVSNCENLEELNCSQNNLTKIDVANNSELTVIECKDNRIAKLDLSKNEKIIEVWCDDDVIVTGCDESKINPEEETSIQDETTTASEAVTGRTEEITTKENLTAATNNRPKAPKIKKIKAKKRALRVRWKKVAKVKGYQIKYSRTRKMTNYNQITIINAKKKSMTIKRLKSRKRYYVRIRAFVVKNGKRYYSKWSKRRSKKTK